MAWDDEILSSRADPGASPAAVEHRFQVAATPYLSAQPLIFGIGADSPLALTPQPPQRIWKDLIAEQAHAGLVPVLDLQRAYSPLIVLPAGAVSCAGPCYAAQIYSHVPAKRLAAVWADVNGQTAAALAIVIWGVEFRRRLRVITYDPSRQEPPKDASAVLVTEDRVVSHPPVGFHYKLDLGAMWFEITGLPFVFSVWAAEDGAHLQEIHDLLLRSRLAGKEHLKLIARRHSPLIGWPRKLAEQCLANQLHYEFADAHRDGMEEFFYLCEAFGLIERFKLPKYLYEPA